MLISESKRIDKFQSEMDKFYEDFSKCIMCKNCRNMCPVCYCIDCVFNGDEYLPKGYPFEQSLCAQVQFNCPKEKNSFILLECIMFHRPVSGAAL